MYVINTNIAKKEIYRNLRIFILIILFANFKAISNDGMCKSDSVQNIEGYEYVSNMPIFGSYLVEINPERFRSKTLSQIIEELQMTNNYIGNYHAERMKCCRGNRYTREVVELFFKDSDTSCLSIRIVFPADIVLSEDNDKAYKELLSYCRHWLSIYRIDVGKYMGNIFKVTDGESESKISSYYRAYKIFKEAYPNLVKTKGK